MGAITITVANPSGGLSSDIQVEDNAFLTATPLAGAGVYTSPAIALNGRRLVGNVFADQAGTFVVQGSDDGTNWKTLPSGAFSAATGYSAGTVSASTYAPFDVLLSSGLTRVVYTNGATIQTVFRFSAYLASV